MLICFLLTQTHGHLLRVYGCLCVYEWQSRWEKNRNETKRKKKPVLCAAAVFHAAKAAPPFFDCLVVLWLTKKRQKIFYGFFGRKKVFPLLNNLSFFFPRLVRAFFQKLREKHKKALVSQCHSLLTLTCSWPLSLKKTRPKQKQIIKYFLMFTQKIIIHHINEESYNSRSSQLFFRIIVKIIKETD